MKFYGNTAFTWLTNFHHPNSDILINCFNYFGASCVFFMYFESAWYIFEFYFIPSV